jgi:hypothetical protein
LKWSERLQVSGLDQGEIERKLDYGSPKRAALVIGGASILFGGIMGLIFAYQLGKPSIMLWAPIAAGCVGEFIWHNSHRNRIP